MLRHERGKGKRENREKWDKKECVCGGGGRNLG